MKNLADKLATYIHNYEHSGHHQDEYYELVNNLSEEVADKITEKVALEYLNREQKLKLFPERKLKTYDESIFLSKKLAIEIIEELKL